MDRDVPVFKKKVELNDARGPSNVLYKFKGDDRYVIRESDPVEFKGYGYDQMTMEQVAGTAQELFNEIKEYGIVAPVQYIVAENEHHQKRVFAVTDKIQESPHLEGEDRQKYIDAHVELYRALVRYYTDKVANGSPFLDDVMYSDQYMYGRKPHDDNERLYLIDTDPWFSQDLSRLAMNLRLQMRSNMNAFAREYTVDLSKEMEDLDILIHTIDPNVRKSR